MNIHETGRLLLSILLFFDQLLHFLLGLCGTLWHIVAHCGTLWHIVAHCGTLWHIVAHCGTLWHVHICSLLGFKIWTSNFSAGNLAWSQVGLSSLGSFGFAIRCHPEILEKSGECPTVATLMTLMCITWNSTPCLPQAILRMSQHLLIFFQILGQDFQILQNNSTTSLWLRFKQSPSKPTLQHLNRTPTSTAKMALQKKEVAWQQFFESTWSIFTMFLHVCDDGNHDDAPHRNTWSTWSTTRTAPIGGPSRSSGRFQFLMLLVCCQLPSVTEKATSLEKVVSQVT